MQHKHLPKALVVDDNVEWLDTLAKLAGEIGYDVLRAQGYSEALHHVQLTEEPIELIVTDVKLRDNDPSNVDGLHLLRILRENVRIKYGIVVTGYPNSTSKSISRELEAEYLVKGRFTKADFRRAEAKMRETQNNNSSGKAREASLSLTHTGIRLFFSSTLRVVSDPLIRTGHATEPLLSRSQECCVVAVASNDLITLEHRRGCNSSELLDL